MLNSRRKKLYLKTLYVVLITTIVLFLSFNLKYTYYVQNENLQPDDELIRQWEASAKNHNNFNESHIKSADNDINDQKTEGDKIVKAQGKILADLPLENYDEHSRILGNESNKRKNSIYHKVKLPLTNVMFNYDKKQRVEKEINENLKTENIAETNETHLAENNILHQQKPTEKTTNVSNKIWVKAHNYSDEGHGKEIYKFQKITINNSFKPQVKYQKAVRTTRVPWTNAMENNVQQLDIKLKANKHTTSVIKAPLEQIQNSRIHNTDPSKQVTKINLTRISEENEERKEDPHQFTGQGHNREENINGNQGHNNSQDNGQGHNSTTKGTEEIDKTHQDVKEETKKEIAETEHINVNDGYINVVKLGSNGHKNINNMTGKQFSDNILSGKLQKQVDIKNLFSVHKKLDQHQNWKLGTIRPNFCSKCFKNDFTFLINPAEKCRDISVKLLLLITSSPEHFEIRKVIRDTWGSHCQNNATQIVCVFILGLKPRKSFLDKVHAESYEHKDIVQLDFTDSYRNLTYKSLSAFRWAEKHCPSARYIMKTDDDMFVNTLLLPQILDKAPSTFFFGGFCWGSSIPERNPAFKWSISYRDYPLPRFPPMCSGTGYVMSNDVLRAILSSSQDIPFVYLEDVYVALCVEKLDLKPVKLQGFFNMYKQFFQCYYRNFVITSHGVSSDKLIAFWRGTRQCDNHEHQLSYSPQYYNPLTLITPKSFY